MIVTGWDWAPYLKVTGTGDHVGVNVKVIDTYSQLRGFSWRQIGYQYELNMATHDKHGMWWGPYQVLAIIWNSKSQQP